MTNTNMKSHKYGMNLGQLTIKLAKKNQFSLNHKSTCTTFKKYIHSLKYGQNKPYKYLYKVIERYSISRKSCIL